MDRGSVAAGSIPAGSSMKEKTKSGCGAAVVAMAIVPFSVALRGWAVSVLWGWFVVPLGVAAIGMWNAAGISLIAGFLTYRSDLTTKDDNDKSPWDAVIRATAVAVLLPMLMLAFGAAYRGLMP